LPLASLEGTTANNPICSKAPRILMYRERILLSFMISRKKFVISYIDCVRIHKKISNSQDSINYYGMII